MALLLWKNVLLSGFMILHIMNCPYTKVEESFNIQAVHDILYFRMNIDDYDHQEFPGVVPRTFIGALFMSLVSAPFSIVQNFMKENKLVKQVLGSSSKFMHQFLARIILGSFTLISFAIYKKSVSKVLSPSISNLATLFTITQFHFLFYASRPLPNTFALVLVLPALGYWLQNKTRVFIWLSAFACIIFRFELCLLVGPLLLINLFNCQISVAAALKHSITSGVLALSVTVLIDSIFWRRVLWPEGIVLYYNTILNKSSQWGTSPFLWYFYSVIPRCLLFTLIFVPFGVSSKHKTFLWLLVSIFIFVFAYSMLPHKELRFIIYTIPVLNTAAAVGLIRIFHWIRKHSFLSKICYLGLAVLLLGNLSLSGLLSYISHYNYPGGVALTRLHQIADPKKGNVSVHVDNYAAQTGVTRFGERFSHWRYSKEENLHVSSRKLLQFDYLLREAPCNRFLKTHQTLDIVKGFQRLNLNLWSWKSAVEIKIVDKICILERREST